MLIPELPIELFFLGVLLPIIFVVIGLASNPRQHWMIIGAGLFISIFAMVPENLTMNERISQIAFIPQNVTATSETLVKNYSYNVESNTGTNNLAGDAVNHRAFGMLLANGDSELIGDEVECIDIYVKKSGSPTGNAILGLINATGFVENEADIIGTIDVETITGSSSWMTVCLPNDDRIILAEGDRIGITYHNGTGGVDFITISGDGNNPFDGTNTHRQQYLTSMTSTTSADITMRLYTTDLLELPVTFEADTEQYDYEKNNFTYSELTKTLFMAIGMIVIVCSMMLIRNEK